MDGPLEIGPNLLHQAGSFKESHRFIGAQTKVQEPNTDTETEDEGDN